MDEIPSSSGSSLADESRAARELGEAADALHATLRAIVVDAEAQPEEPPAPLRLAVLHDQVIRVTIALRASGVPAERALLRVKERAAEAGLGSVRGILVDHPLIDTMVAWCVQAYYRCDGDGVDRGNGSRGHENGR